MALCIIFGLPLVFLHPPLLLPGDEPTHFYRVYQISEFRISSEARDYEGGGMLPASISKTIEILKSDMFEVPGHKLELLKDIPKLPLAPEEKTWTEFTGAALYSPVPYIPHAAGVLIGRIFSATPLALLYIARICSLLAWAVIGAYAIKIIPFYRTVVFILLLTPVAFIKAANVNADVITVGACTLFVCQVLKMTYGAENFKRGDIYFLFGLAMVIGLSKIAYAPLTAFCFLIPSVQLGGRKRFWLICGGIVFSAFAVSLLWMAYLYFTLHLMADPYALPGMQLKYMLTNPFEFFMIVWRYTTSQFWANVRGTFGECIVWREVWMPLWIVYSLWAAVFTAAVADGHEAVIGIKNKAGISAVVLISYVVIIASLYISYTPYMRDEVWGMQPRYSFHFILPLLLLLKIKKPFSFNAFPVGLAAVIISLSAMLIVMSSRYI